MAQELKINTAFPEDTSLVASITSGQFTISNSSSRGTSTLFWFLWVPTLTCAHNSTTDTHTHKSSQGENWSGVVPYHGATTPLTSISSLTLRTKTLYSSEREMKIVRYIICWRMTLTAGHNGAHCSPTTGEVEANESWTQGLGYVGTTSPPPHPLPCQRPS